MDLVNKISMYCNTSVMDVVLWDWEHPGIGLLALCNFCSIYNRFPDERQYQALKRILAMPIPDIHKIAHIPFIDKYPNEDIDKIKTYARLTYFPLDPRL